MDKSIFLYWWFSFDLQYYLILVGTNNVLLNSVKKILCTLWSLALAKKSCTNINNSLAQVSRLKCSSYLPTLKNRYEKILTVQPSTLRGQLCFRDSKVTFYRKGIYCKLQKVAVKSRRVSSQQNL